VRECQPCFALGDNASAWSAPCQPCAECLPYKSCAAPTQPFGPLSPQPFGPLAPQAAKPEVVTIELRLDGSVESFMTPIMDPKTGNHYTKVDVLRSDVATRTGLPLDSVDVSVRAGSLLVDITLAATAANQLLGDIDAKNVTQLAGAMVLAVESRGVPVVAPGFCAPDDVAKLGLFGTASDDQKPAIAASLTPGCIACLTAPNTNAAKCMGGPVPPQCDANQAGCPCSAGDMKTILRTNSVDASKQTPEQAQVQKAILFQTLPPPCMRCIVADTVNPKDEKCFGLVFGSKACASSEAQACLGRCAACANPHTAQALSMCSEPDCVQCAPFAACLGLPASDAPIELAAKDASNAAIKSAGSAIAGEVAVAKRAVPSGSARPTVAPWLLVLALASVAAVCHPGAEA